MQLHEAKILFETDDDTISKDGHIQWWCDNYNKAAELAGIKNVCEDLKGYLEEAGFQDVKVVIKKLPINPWPKHARKKVCTYMSARSRPRICGNCAANIVCRSSGNGG